ncbi:MAG TPA: DNA adenine methylase, partial [Acidimicrobiales bacterium]|nr:DNA adenine methylase [Acidimicrobiales bacterium]
MIKYIGSKRRLVPVLGELFERSGADRVLDLFTGTTRVAQEWKRRGALVTAVDSARYAAVLAGCYIESDAARTDVAGLEAALFDLQHLDGRDG